MLEEAKKKDAEHIVYFEFEDGIIAPRAVDGVKYKNLEIGTVIEVTFKEIMGMTADYEIVDKESVPNLNKTVLKLQRRSLFEDR